MSVREIPPDDWKGFLEDFSRQHRAWLASVTRRGPEAERQTQVFERPLGSVSAGPDGIHVRFQLDSQVHDAVRIEAPSRLRVEESPDGAARRVEIETREGERIEIALRVPAPPGLLDGVAPGEL